MADYPATIYTPRVVENAPMVTFDASKTTVGYAEDVNLSNDEIVAIQETLGLNPQGAFDTVVDRLDHALTLPTGVSLETSSIPYVDESGVLKSDNGVLSYEETNNTLVVGGATDGDGEASTRLRVRDGNIKFDNGHGVLIKDSFGNDQAVLALTTGNNVDMANPVDGGNFRLLAGDGGQVQFHFGGTGGSLRSYMEDTGNLVLGDTLILGDLSERCEFDITNLTDTRVVTLPDNDVLMATAVIADTDQSGSRALDTSYTNSSDKSLWIMATVTMDAGASTKMTAKFWDNSSVDYCANVGTGGGTPNAYRLTFQMQCIVPPGANYYLKTAVVGTGSWTLVEWRERYL